MGEIRIPAQDQAEHCILKAQGKMQALSRKTFVLLRPEFLHLIYWLTQRQPNKERTACMLQASRKPIMFLGCKTRLARRK